SHRQRAEHFPPRQIVVSHDNSILRSNYPPAKPEALRWLAPQRGLTAAVGKRPLTRPRPSATLSPREREKVIARRSAPNTAFALSRGRGWTAPRVLSRGRGTGEGSCPRPTSRNRQTATASPAEPGDLPTN